MAKLDELTIEIKDNAKETARNFDTLSNSLKKLSNVDTKSVYKNLNSVSRILKNFSNEIKSLDTSKINSLATAMNSMASSTKKSMQSASKSVDNVNKNLSNSTKKSKQTVDEFMASIKGIGKNQQFFGSSSQLNTEIASTKNKIEKVKTALEAYNQEGKSVETKGWRTAQRQLEQYTNYLDTLMSKQRLATSTAKGFQFDEKAIAGSKENIYKLLLSDAEYNKMRESILAKQPIEIPTTIKTDNISKTISNSISKVTPINTKSITEQVTKAEKTVQDASAKMRSALMFEPTKLGIGQKYTKEYTALEKEILKAEKELEKYLNTQEKLDSLGVKNDSQRYKNVQLNIDQTDAKLQKLYQDMKILQTEGGDIINPNAFDNLSDRSSKAQSVMQSLTKALRAGGFGGAASTVQKLSADVGSLSGGMSQLGASAEGASGAMVGMSAAIPVIGLILAAVTLLVKAFTSLAKAAVNAMKKIGNAIKGVVTKIKELITNILSVGTASNQAHTVLGKFINKIVGLFKSRVLRQAITQAIQYMKDGFASLDVYSNSIGSKFHTNVQTIIADLKWLGRTIAAAFEPIINVATPILDFLIDKLVTVINYINQFFAALSGSKTWTKAVKTASDYSSATSGAAKAQKDLNKQIREWDKLNVITDPNKNSSGGGGSTSGASGDGFVTEDVSNSIKDLAKRIKEAWDTDADFTWLGTEIGTKVKDTLDKIPWEEKIKPAAAKFGTALATLINGFVEVPGLADTIGKTIAQAINTALTFFENFTSNIHGDSIGTFIGELVGSALRNIEWDKYITSMGNLGRELAKGINALANTDVLSEISKSFAKVLKGGIEGAYQFVTNLDFKNLGTKVGTAISDFFKEMNEKGEDGKSGFSKLGETFSKAASGIMDFIINALDSLDWDEIGQSVIDFVTAVDWGDLFLKALELKEKIKKAAWEAIKLAFKSIVIAKGDIDIDIAKAIKDKWDDAKEWLKDKALDIGVKVGDFVQSAKDKWNEIKQWLVDKALDIAANIPDIVQKIKDKIEEIKTWLTTNLLDIGLNIKDSASSVISNIVDKWNKLGEKNKELKAKVTGGAVDAIKKIKDAWKGLKANTKNFTVNLKGKALSLIEKLKGIWDGLSTKAKNLSVTFTDNFTRPLKSAWNSIANTINNATAKISSKIPKLPTFQGYATGGFPEDGWFRASHGEYFGKFDNGQSVIANNKQIENGLMNTVRVGNSELVSLMAQELTATRQQNQLLTQILQKETGISYKDVFKATQKGNREYKAMNGVSAFV